MAAPAPEPLAAEPAIAMPGSRRLGSNPATTLQLALGLALVIVSSVLPAILGSAYWSYNFLIVNLFVAVAILQNMLLSDAGQVSFGQGAVFGLAAYTTGIVAGLWGQSYLVGALAGFAAALALG